MAKRNRRHSGGGREGGGGSPAKRKATEAKSQDDAKAPNLVTEPDQPRNGAVMEWVKSLLVAAVLFVVIRTFILQTFVITSGSMEGALLVGDFLIANRAAVGVRIPFTQTRIPGTPRSAVGTSLSSIHRTSPISSWSNASSAFREILSP